MSKEKYRGRVHMLLLYTDNEQHCQALEKIKQSYDYAIVLHNRDIDSNGEPKKEHWHIVLRFKQAVWNTAISKDLGIEERFIESVKKFDNALQYLIHYNDSDKAQYDINEVSGPLQARLIDSINKGDKNEVEKVREILYHIDFLSSTEKRKISITEVAIYCADNGLWSEFRRGATIILKIIEEYNNRY